MVKTATKFTPEVLLSTPRRSAGQPSPDGKYILHTVQTYSFESRKRVRELRVLELARGLSHLVIGDGEFTEAVWLPNNKILYLRDGHDALDGGDETGRTELLETDITGQIRSSVGDVPGKIADVKVKQLSNGDIAFVCWGRADRHGNLVNEKEKKKPAHTSMLYDKLMVRHWDTYKDRYHNSLFYGILTKSGLLPWTIKSFESLLAGTRLESPTPPYPSADFYDLSETGVIFIAKNPDLNDATHTRSDLYFIPTPSDALIPNFSQTSPMMVAANTIDGAASSPVFAPDGRSAAFLKMTEDGYEADRNLVIYVPDIAGACLYTSSGDCSISCPQNCNSLHQAARPVTFMAAGAAAEPWDISPSKLEFGRDSNSLFLLAEQEAVTSVFFCDVPTGTLEKLGYESSIGSVSEMKALGDRGRIFLSGSNLVDNSVYAFVDPHNWSEPQIKSSHSKHGTRYGLHKKQVESFYYESEEGRFIHALVMKPSDFDESKKYPLAMLIHGGPQGAWLDSWSTRWNPAVWAEQGYVVVMPNVTGSTGYGQGHVDAITKNWGKGPYEDIVKLWEHLEANHSYIDMERAVAAGASYGGYMMYWIQGQPLGRKFKTLIAHDGVFNAIGAQMSGDELWFPFHDFGGTLWDESGRKEWEKYDPSRFTKNWDTPMLVIHNGKDYRLSIAEGLAAFNVLQVKGIPSRFLTAPDENHWTLNEENSRVWHTVVLNWANKYAGLQPYRDDESSVIEPNEPFDH